MDAPSQLNCLSHIYPALNQLASINRIARGRLTAHPSAVNDQTLARDVVAGPAGEVDNGTLEVLGRTPSSSGDSLQDLSRSDRVGNECFVHLPRALVSIMTMLRLAFARITHVRGDVAWGDGVDIDALGSPAV